MPIFYRFFCKDNLNYFDPNEYIYIVKKNLLRKKHDYICM